MRVLDRQKSIILTRVSATILCSTAPLRGLHYSIRIREMDGGQAQRWGSAAGEGRKVRGHKGRTCSGNEGSPVPRPGFHPWLVLAPLELSFLPSLLPTFLVSSMRDMVPRGMTIGM